MFNDRKLTAGLIFWILVVVMVVLISPEQNLSNDDRTEVNKEPESSITRVAVSDKEDSESAPVLQAPPEIVRATFPDSAGKTYFNEQVLPRLAENGCVFCHMPGAGYVRPEISYDGLFPFLAMGQAADNNVLMLKIANQRSFAPDQPNHPGGKRCESEDTDPCKTIQAWWKVEFGDGF